MKAVYVEPVKTILTFEEAYECMKWALKTRLCKEPSIEVLALALAKTALETNVFKSMWNFNFGNVKASDTYEGMYTCIFLNECLQRNGKIVTVWFTPQGELTAHPKNGGKLVGQPMPVPEGHPQTRMRAFANNYDGVDCYVDFVANGRYKKAWQALLTGNATNYVHELKLAGYFTAPESEYIKGVAALQKQFIAKLTNKKEEIVDIDWIKLKETVPQLQFDLTDETLNFDLVNNNV